MGTHRRGSDGRRRFSADFKREQLGRLARQEVAFAGLSRELGIDQVISAEDVPLLKAELAKAYSGLESRAVTRDLDVLVEMDIALRVRREYVDNFELLQSQYSKGRIT